MGPCAKCDGAGTTKRRSAAACAQCADGRCRRCDGGRTVVGRPRCKICDADGGCRLCQDGRDSEAEELPCDGCSGQGQYREPCDDCQPGAKPGTTARTPLTIANRFAPTVNLLDPATQRDGDAWHGYVEGEETRWPQDIVSLYLSLGQVKGGISPTPNSVFCRPKRCRGYRSAAGQTPWPV